MIPKFPRRYRFSLRARATTWYVGLMAVALLVFSIAIYIGIRTYLKVSLQRGLVSTAHTIAEDYLSKLPSKGQSWVLGEIRESYDSIPSDHYARLSVGAEVLYQSADMHDPSVPISAIGLPGPVPPNATVRPPLIGDLVLPRLDAGGNMHRQEVGGLTVLIYTLPFRAPDGRLILVESGASLYSMQQTQRSLTKVLCVATIVILVLATFGGYFLMKQPLRPLAVLTEKAARIGRKGLGERLPVPPTGDELELLAHSLNGMIDRLEEALNHNHRFSADASHELRTPLTIMRGELEEMLCIEELPQQAVENVVSAIEEIDRMSRIVNSLMAITRLDAGGERMDMQVIDFSVLVRSTVEHLRLLADEKGLPLACTIEDDVYVFADPMRIKQVLVNLIDNAVKYSQPRDASSDLSGESAPDAAGGQIDVAVVTTGTNAVLRITDRGIGIAPAILPHVFDRFYRADFARNRDAGGVGLGLAIVKAIIAAHNGNVSISSTLGQGSTVVVELPLGKRTAPVIQDEPTSGRRQTHYQTT
jgi:signal transduction histidine kinase